MDYQFSDRMNGLDGSATREIFKLLSRPEIISFAGGLPANEYLPTEIINEIVNELLLSSQSRAALQYGTTEGFIGFRTELVKYLAEAGINNIDTDNTLVISGGQQGIDLMCKVFLNKGDVVLVEDPTYLAFLQILKTYEGKAVGVKTTDSGLDLDDLKQKIIKYKPKMLYCVPTFSNPTGKTYTLDNREKIAEITAKYGVMVLEDDPYSKLRFSGNSVPALKSFDNSGNVVYITSFSKLLSPGMRVGVAAGEKSVIRKLTIAKQGTDLHTSNLSQLITKVYLEKGYLKKNVALSLPLYTKRLNSMLKAIDTFMPEEFVHTRPEGGLFVWGEFNCDLDTKLILPEAIQNDVAYIQGSEFYANKEDGKRSLRLNFSNENDERINKGIKALGDLYKKKISEREKTFIGI